MKTRMYIAVCGIHTVPGSSMNWTAKFVRYINSQTQHKADKVEYFTSVFTRTSGQNYRAEQLKILLKEYGSYFQLHLVAHSNGADVVVDALRNSDTFVEKLTLLAPAISPDFHKTGLNTTKIGELCLHRGSSDAAMVVAGLPLGLAFGFGNLGSVNVEPKNCYREVKKHTWDGGHSVFFERDNFEKLMREHIL